MLSVYRQVEVPEGNKSYFSNRRTSLKYNFALYELFRKELRASVFQNRLDDVFTHAQKKRSEDIIRRGLLGCPLGDPGEAINSDSWDT